MTDAATEEQRAIWPSSRIALVWVITALLFAAAMLPYQTRRPLADGTFYIGTMHSLYVDGDVDLRDEAVFYPWLKFHTLSGTAPPNGLRNPFPLGTSIVWLPFYAAFDAVDRMFGGPGITESPRAGPAYFATSFWVFVGIGVVAGALGSLGAGRREKLVIPLALVALSPLPAYVTFAPEMSHGVAFALAAILLWTCLWCSRQPSVDSPRWIACGIALGLLTLTRWQDATLAIVPALLLLTWRDESEGRPPLSRRIRGGLWVAAGAVPMLLPQLAAWRSVYGSWMLLPGTDEHLGAGEGFLSLSNAEPFAFFFSTWNGAFLCHPVLLLSLIGLVVGLPRRDTGASRTAGNLRAAVLCGVLLQVASSLIVRDWWSGGSFGQRRFVSLLPFLALGLYALWRRAGPQQRGARGVAIALVAVLGLWNGLSLYRLHERSLPYNPASTAWYRSGVVYERYDLRRRFSDVLFGAEERADAATRKKANPWKAKKPEQ